MSESRLWELLRSTLQSTRVNGFNKVITATCNRQEDKKESYFNNEYTKQISQARYSSQVITPLAQKQFHAIIPVHLSVLFSIQFKK
jgi:hypothetical protein